jgi:phage terminase large subunit GpA-like protein
MLVQPTLDLAKRFSRQRVEPLVTQSPCLARKVLPARQRDSANTVLSKGFPGGILVMAGANSPASFRQMPIRYLFADEIDAWPEIVGEEGDPMRLAERGTKTFRRRKILEISTPTIEGRSRIKRSFDKSDQRYYHVPCPHCGRKQRLVWQDEEGRRGIQWEGDDPSTAHYVCAHCEGTILEHHKTRMLAGGEWIAENPSSQIHGYHLNALYTPPGLGLSWVEIVELWYKVKDNPNELRVFVNQVLGQTWKEAGDAPPWEELYNRREEYKIGLVPQEALVLTAGVDLQQDRIELEIVGWGRNSESWSVDYRVLPGDIATDAPWSALTEVLDSTYEHESGARLPIRMACVDTGHFTQTAYNWIRRRGRRDQTIAIKGRDTHPVLIGSANAVEVKDLNGRRYKRGILLWIIGTNIAKQELYGRLRIPKPPIPQESGYPRGYVHFPEYPEGWFKGLTAEQVVVRIVRGYRKYVWEQTRERNEPLDCRVYARAAAQLVGIDRWSDEHWDRTERHLGQPSPAPAKRRRRSRPRAGGGFGRWHSRKHN